MPNYPSPPTAWQRRPHTHSVAGRSGHYQDATLRLLLRLLRGPRSTDPRWLRCSLGLPHLLLRVLTLGLVSLGTTLSFGGNDTPVYPYQIDRSTLAASPLDTVVIASGPLGKPPRQYLREHEATVDAAVAKYLQKNRITVSNNSTYQAALSAAQRQLGEPYDASTDHIDMNAQQQVLAAVFEQLRHQQPTVDAVIFTELVHRDVYFSSGLKHTARWDGVSRSPLLQGPGQGVSVNFNWAQPFDAVSLGIYVFTVTGKRVFMSAGGLSLTEAIDTRSSKPKVTRYKKVLANKSQIKEGVKIALHPLIPMKRYPGKEQ